MKSRHSGIERTARGFFILAAATAAAFLAPAATYSADRNDEYLISLPDRKASSTKPKITTEKKEPAAQTQPAEPARPVSRQSLLSGKGSSSSTATDSGSSAAEPAKNNSRSGLLRGPGAGRQTSSDAAVDDEAAETATAERDPNLRSTVTTWTEGTTDYQTITEYEGDTVIETEIVTEHTRGMIVETTTVTETRNGKVVRKTKNKTTRKEESASAPVDKQTKTILGRAQELKRAEPDAPASATGASKPASAASTNTTTTTTKTQASGKTTATTTKNASAGTTAQKPAAEKQEPVAAQPSEAQEETPVEPEPVKKSEEDVVKFDPIVEPDPVPSTPTKKPDYSDQKSSGTVANPFGTARPSGKDK